MSSAANNQSETVTRVIERESWWNPFSRQTHTITDDEGNTASIKLRVVPAGRLPKGVTESAEIHLQNGRTCPLIKEAAADFVHELYRLGGQFTFINSFEAPRDVLLKHCPVSASKPSATRH